VISDRDLNTIRTYARKFNLSSVILFGSSLKGDDFNDIDLGVKGLDPALFFSFYGQLMLHLSTNVDVVDLTQENAFNRIVESEGVEIYGNTQREN